MAGLVTKLDSAEVLADGAVQIRLEKCFVDDAGTATALGYHRSVLTPLSDAGAQLDAVDAALQASGAPALSAEDRSILIDLAAALHTQERRAAYAAARAASSPFPAPL